MPAHSFSDPNNGWLSLAARIKFPRPPASVLFVNDLKTLKSFHILESTYDFVLLQKLPIFYVCRGRHRGRIVILGQAQSVDPPTPQRASIQTICGEWGVIPPVGQSVALPLMASLH